MAWYPWYCRPVADCRCGVCRGTIPAAFDVTIAGLVGPCDVYNGTWRVEYYGSACIRRYQQADPYRYVRLEFYIHPTFGPVIRSSIWMPGGMFTYMWWYKSYPQRVWCEGLVDEQLDPGEPYPGSGCDPSGATCKVSAVP